MIDQARADGLELRANGDKLKLSGTAAAVKRWKPRLVASKAEIMAALSATAADIAQAEPEPARACSSCAYRPPGWLSIQPAPCGNPVAAGLATQEGVIRYHPNNGADCATWKALT
jgi:hypothetical protein